MQKNQRGEVDESMLWLLFLLSVNDRAIDPFSIMLGENN